VIGASGISRRIFTADRATTLFLQPSTDAVLAPARRQTCHHRPAANHRPGRDAGHSDDHESDGRLRRVPAPGRQIGLDHVGAERRHEAYHPTGSSVTP
jgi:hypothetical protein